ncbi:MAG: AMP-binding protein [Deltaproteobacteria bacterium]|nr:AMP-binding protein [Deltaproteobacteria bacterium]
MLKVSTFAEIPRAAAEAFGERTALDDEAMCLTYTELRQRVEQAARGFIGIGLQPGERVAVWAQNLPEWIFAALGAQSVGGVLVPLNTRYKGEEAAYILRKSGARVLCTVGEFLDIRFLDLLRSAAGEPIEGRPFDALEQLTDVVLLRGDPVGGTRTWQEFLSAGKAVDASELTARVDAVEPADLCDILFTSGTTGHPKGVMTSHAQALRSTSCWIDAVGLRGDDRYLIVNPFFHMFGYRSGWLASFLVGAMIRPEPVLDIPRVLSLVAEKKVTVLPGPPTLYQSILAHPDLDRFDLSSLRLGITGAASIPIDLVRSAHERLGFESFATGYGLTENSGSATMTRPDDDFETVATTSGRAIEGVELAIVDAGGQPLPPGSPGEILLRGPNVMAGYFGDPEATAETVDAEGWLHTGDVGVVDEAGNLRVTDRIKDMLVVGGFNVYPAEVESLLSSHPAVVHVAVIGVADERLGEVGRAYVVRAQGDRTSADEIIDWARERMANFKVPRSVEFLDELPMTPSGKVQKHHLRQRAGA